MERQTDGETDRWIDRQTPAAAVGLVRIMETSFSDLTAAVFLQFWTQFDRDDDGFIDRKKLDEFLRCMMKTLKAGDVCEQQVQRVTETILTSCDITDGHLQMEELAAVLLPEQENFLLLFRREAPLENSVEFMRIWRCYDADSSGYISAAELKSFLRDLFHQHNKQISTGKLEEYTDTMMKMFDKNQDGRLDLNDLARILALKENFLLKFDMEACSHEDRRRDFEKIFAHYDVSNTGDLEGAEVDGFVKDMMELVKPSLSGSDLDKFKQVLLGHCDLNRDGKIQKNELALCLGLKLNP
ncbi:secretagogin-like [Myxocyprinus asiaticus]|uniref:secretagogin-like n=1 Tax=Myxocyprinus asiaticus TaxID=70543 RepID=UPI002222010A|nr:secretagogin-like [Myxocyprinus asiaticus]XP_051520063.1 secretagogin-like [Myxocyprinus asiaticus]XP_051520064.1 secretagogin-like [Myxocyprinus asiaticus]XP_051520065.1 secretagogin-like [Myxocyprinus asiaticus]XP_051520066.1 secretagogin-like [Myxocyprinus asiaticus]XP_051520067.1 secretagogin-like [Myxocyprinus asiaticus]XP_051520069.1 secretagogin-like [Myxocyprinus asiaticus]XP_051520070.1 secretagogin-like [Myxocyprinus asiaticus]XP_051520071.1 secretagogin-like [Myxocyprinus asia